MNPLNDDPKNFTVRFSPRAESDAVEIAYAWAEYNANPTGGLALHAEFHEAAGRLAFLPERQVIQQEVSKQLEMTVRRILVRHWHLYYEALPDSLDGPLVRVVFLRDARMAPLTQEEAERIKAGQ